MPACTHDPAGFEGFRCAGNGGTARVILAQELVRRPTLRLDMPSAALSAAPLLDSASPPAITSSETPSALPTSDVMYYMYMSNERRRDAARRSGPGRSARRVGTFGLMESGACRFRVFAALVAWLAQLCLPMAHVASMASSAAGALAWCGTGSVALQARLAQLPVEIREILLDGATQTDDVDDCAQLCAATGGPALVEAVPVTVALRAAGLGVLIAEFASPAFRPHGAPPPARGPPSYS
ncbi:MAG: hypothetical protein CMH65_08090 [Nevskiales bacterium]|nr:hypothetical protein [Nevskiales bacterium]